MDNKYILPIVVFAVLAVLAIFLLLSASDNTATDSDNNETGIILYVGTGCPYCKIVEDYLNQNNVSEKVSFTKKNVDTDINNSNEFLNKAKLCDIPSNLAGVPLLWTGNDCLIGSPDIIEFFENKNE